MTAHQQMTADEQWLALLNTVKNGQIVNARYTYTREIINVSSVIDMRFPVLTIPERKLGYRFMAAEAHWILSGDNRLNPLLKYAPSYGRFSDDGIYMFGAYGPRIMGQMSYILETLATDPDSRRAVINIWRDYPPESKDTPCTLSLQFLLRNGWLNTIATMRSSDLWLGWPYDVFSFSMITYYVLLQLSMMDNHKRKYRPGTLYLNAGSQHIYHSNYDKVIAINKTYNTFDEKPWLSRTIRPMSIYDYESPVCLMDHLRWLMDTDEGFNQFMMIPGRQKWEGEGT